MLSKIRTNMCHLQEISLMRDAGQIMDDLIPMGRLEGDVLYRGCWIVKIWFSGLGIFN